MRGLDAPAHLVECGAGLVADRLARLVPGVYEVRRVPGAEYSDDLGHYFDPTRFGWRLRSAAPASDAAAPGCGSAGSTTRRTAAWSALPDAAPLVRHTKRCT